MSFGSMNFGGTNERPMTPEEIRTELLRFNEQRKNDYGRAPTSDNPLRLAPTGRGGDVWPMPGDNSWLS